MKKKITFVINFFHPDYASTGQLMTELCRELQDDFAITVIAAQPDPQVIERFALDDMENIRVVRIRLPKVDKTSKRSRAIYMVSYFIWATIALLRERGTDIIYTISSPPILGGLIGTIGKLLKRSKHVYNIQDFNPEQAQAVSYANNQAVYKVARAVDNLSCRLADEIVLVGQDMADTLRQRFDGRQTPTHRVINNWTNEQEIVPLDNDDEHVQQFMQRYGIADKFIVMYSGNLGLYYDLEQLVKLAGRFTDIEDLLFVFIGDGAVKPTMERYVRDAGLANVRFIPFQLKEEIRISLNAGDVHLVVNQKGIKGVSVPSKIYGVMAAGKPIIGVLEEGSEAQMLIAKSQSGIVVEPQQYDEIEEAIREIYKMNKEERIRLGQNGRRYLEEHLTRARSIAKYRTMLHEL
jgi:colanic acid biosynthesis glycosyl transferase WcaI